MKRVCVIALACLLLVPALPTRIPATAADTPPLVALLALVPDQPTLHESGSAAPRFVDFQALYMVEGIDTLRRGDFDALNEQVPLPGILGRIAMGPEALSYVFASIDQMRQTVGFQWIADVDRSLDFGAPPQTGMILQGELDPTVIGAALSARGFEETDVDGVAVWSRYEDGAISPANRDVSDPFGGQLGSAARVALLPDGIVANARFSAVTESIVAASQGTVSSLADAPDYRALADAITAPDGLLVQAWFLDPGDVAVVDLRLPADAPDPTAGLRALAPYSLAVLADREEGSDQVHLIGLVYPTAEEAQAAAAEVAQRLSVYSPPSQRSGDILVERYGAQVSSRVYDSPTTGNAVALVELRYPLPADRIDPDTGLYISGGLLYRALVNAVLRRELTPLVVVAP